MNLANNPGGAAESNPQGAAEPELANDADVIDNEEVENEDGDQPQPQDDDTEEVEHEGQKYKLPKPLKGALLMQQDYTKKTQELAEQRRAHEAATQSFAQTQQFQAEFLQEYGTITALDRAIEQYRSTDWNTLRAQNHDAAQQRWFEYQQLKDARDTAASELSTKVTKRQSESAAQAAKRSEDLRASLARDIPGYSPELAGKMQEFGARELGFTPQEIAATTDPRLHRLLHLAMQGKDAMSKAAKAAAAAKTAAAAEGVKPPAQVGNRAQAAKVSASSPQSDKLSDAEWLRRRNAELRAAR